MKKSNLPQNLFLILFMLVGLAVFCVGVFKTVDRNKKMNTYEAVRGGIVDYRERDGENGMVYGAVYAYTVGGKEYTICDDVFTNKIPQIGKRVEIMYDPAAPENAFAKGGVSTGFLLLLLGGMFFAIPLFIFITSNCGFTGKWAEVSQGFIVGLIFAVLGYGLCFGLKQGLSFATICCFIFGGFGVFFMGSSIYALFKPEKKNNGSLADPGLQQVSSYMPDERFYGEAVPNVQLTEEHREKIESVKNKLVTGVNIAREIQRIVAGLITSAVGIFVMSTIINTYREATGMSQVLIVLFPGVFIVIGLFQVVKGIKALVKR